MRIVYLTCHLPFPPISGGRRRDFELVKRLSRDFPLRVLAASKTIAEDRRNAPRLEAYCESVELFPTAPMPAAAEAADEPLQVVRHRAPGLRPRIEQLLDAGEVDLIHVEGFYLMQHVPPDAAVPVLLVEQNVEYELWRQRAAAAASEREAAPANRQLTATRAAEREAWERASVLATLTPEDRALIAAGLPSAAVRLLPGGSDHLADLAPDGSAGAVERPDAPLAALVANFAYAPNVDAALRLARDIMPRVRRAVPDAQLWLVGNAPPAEVWRLAGRDVRVTGRVADVMPYLDAADVVACPLRIGGGVKVKTLEALRRAKAIVASSVAAQGLPASARRGLVVADEPEEFVAELARLLSDAEARQRLELRARRAALELPSWDEAAALVSAAYRELAGERKALVASSSAGANEAAARPSKLS